MIFDEVQVISTHIQPIPLSEVERVEHLLGVQLPEGYIAFITRFGVGRYCDLFRIYAPNQILEEYTKHRDFWKVWYYTDTEGKQHWFFEGSEALLNESQLQESIIVGDSVDGDELVFYPAQPDRIYVLPRHSDRISWVKADFSDLHHWETPIPLLLTFAPWHNQTTLNFLSLEFTLDKANCIEQFKKRWGNDAVLLIHDRTDEWSWNLVCFVPPIGGRVQASQDEGITRTYVDAIGNITTIQGSGTRRLSFQIYCDEEAVADVSAFFVYLEAQGWCYWKNNVALG
jgi:hypothetical protein